MARVRMIPTTRSTFSERFVGGGEDLRPPVLYLRNESGYADPWFQSLLADLYPAPLGTYEPGSGGSAGQGLGVARTFQNTRGRLMPAAIVDPAELRRFALNLKRFNQDLQTQMSALHGQLVGLGQTWRDKENEK